ncbi:MAG: rhamnulokinase [Ruminococcus sp.]|nr:rhamnulokinase [Ruminococcus sp.]
MAKKVLAIDFGASSGRAVVGTLENGRIVLEEIHRFSNDPVMLGDTMYWDVLRLFHEIKQSLIKSKGFGEIMSLGIDTWGVDFGLIDINGRLLENPVHYRDARTKGMLEKAFELVPKESFYTVTGNQFMEINTAFQLMAVAQKRPELLERADKLLMMPNLFTFFLTGEKVTEQSIASTTQLYDQAGSCWAYKLAERLGIKQSLFTNIVPAGAKIGSLTHEIREELGLGHMDVIAVCGHDTQAAMAAVPSHEKDFAFLSCGTWSLLGTELDEPVLDENSLRLNVTNEVGYGGKTSFLKNIIGLWLIQESRRQFRREGREYSFAQLESMAREAKPFQCYIDPDDESFVAAGNIPERIRRYCSETGQYVPQSEGEVIRCIYESLALKYRTAIAELEACTGKKYDKLYMIGGGTKDKLLSQLTASACKITVSSGPVEATALGNIAVQLMASGDIKDISEAREIIARSEEITLFKAESPMQWDKAYEDYLRVTSNKIKEL